MAKCGEVLRFRELPAVIRNGGAHKCEQHRHEACHGKQTKDIARACAAQHIYRVCRSLNFFAVCCSIGNEIAYNGLCLKINEIINSHKNE